MNGKDLLIDLGNISHKYYEEAETVTELNSEHKTIPFRKAVLIAAVIALLAVPSQPAPMQFSGSE